MKGLGDLGNMMKQAKRLQQDLERTQAELTQMKLNATAGGGMVTATVNGRGDLMDLVIEREVIDPEDSEMLVDLVIAAVQEAQKQAREEAEKRLGPLAQGFGLQP